MYLDIEKVRFGHRLRTEIEKPEEALYLDDAVAYYCNRLVENAIKFGLYDTIGEITIRIIAAKQDNQLVIRIENPFDPQTCTTQTGYRLRTELRTTEALSSLCEK